MLSGSSFSPSTKSRDWEQVFPDQAYLSSVPTTMNPQEARCRNTSLYEEAGISVPFAMTTSGHRSEDFSISSGYQTW